MAASLTAGEIMVYLQEAIVTWGMPGADADIIARPAGLEGEESAAIFVDDPVDSMLGGQTATGTGIGFFLHNRTNEPSLLTDEGLALLQAAVDYALGASQVPKLQAGDADPDYDFDQLDLV